MSDHNQPTTSDIEDSSPSIDSELQATKKYLANPNRKKREAKINPEYEAAIIRLLYIYGKDGLNTKSAIIEHIFENESFTKNESDKQISSINSHLTGYKSQCEELFQHYVDLALVHKNPDAREEVRKFAAIYSTNTSKKISEIFHAQLTSISDNIHEILNINKSAMDDDSPEIEQIRDLFINGDITANIPSHRNIAYRLNKETDHKYFNGLNGKQNSGKNRRALEQVLIHNTHFIIETYNRTHIKFIKDFNFDFDKQLTLFHVKKLKGETTGLIEVYEYLLKLNTKLTNYKNEVENDH